MNILNVVNDVLEVVKQPSKTEMFIYSMLASALIVGTIWIVSKVVKFVFRIFKRK